MIADLLQFLQHVLPHFPSLTKEITSFPSAWEIGHTAPTLLHDIANPLTTATSALETVLRDAEPGLQYQPTSIHELTVSLECLQHVQAVLRHSQLSAHFIQSKDIRFSPHQETTTILRLYKAKLKTKKISFQIKISANFHLTGNPIRFRQVVGNLIANAIDASAEKSLIVVDAQENGHHLSLSIKDHGHGIPPALLTRIFQPFFTTKPKEKGSGLGLSIVKRIVEKEFGGEVKVQSQVNKGTTVILKFPRKNKT